MIKIFDANDKDFTTAGNIVINPTKCLEYKKKSLNGWYIEVEMPIKYKDYIEKDKLLDTFKISTIDGVNLINWYYYTNFNIQQFIKL